MVGVPEGWNPPGVTSWMTVPVGRLLDQDTSSSPVPLQDPSVEGDIGVPWREVRPDRERVPEPRSRTSPVRRKSLFNKGRRTKVYK